MNIIDYAKIAKLSYESEDVFKKKITKITNPTNVHFVDAGVNGYSDAQMYVLEYQDKLLFTVRGTSSIKDIITDIGIVKTLFEDVQYSNNINNDKYKEIRVHSGFHHQYNTLKFCVIANIFKRIWDIKYPKPIKIYFTSHSLGAAISSLLAATLKAHFGSKVHVSNYAFGCPKVGNSSFLEFYNDNIDKTYRYVNNNDIVTRLPKIVYAEYNDIIQLGKPNKGDIIDQNLGNISDHSIDNYIKSLEKYIYKNNKKKK
jgi:predicted lipase